MTRGWNPFTNRLDKTGAAISSTNPQTGVVAPEWVVDSRKPWDFYVDTVLWLTYTNPNGSWNIWWRLVQTQATD